VTSRADPNLVLVVDDNETSRYAKARILRRAGQRVLEAASGGEALSLVAEWSPRVIVLDIHLPDIDGWEVCRRIKADPATSSSLVLQVSATHIRDADTVRSLEGGADVSLTEPIEPVVLVATVRALLRSQRAGDALRDALAREHIARTLAESANRAKDEFLATLSHELRSPLSVILAWVTLLRSEPTVDEPTLQRALEAIERNTRLQARMIEDLLDVSRIISGKMTLNLAPVNLAEVLDAAVASLRPAAEVKGIQLEMVVRRAPDPLAGDAARLQQIVSNLLSNALKFTPEGGRIELALDSHGDHVEIQVADTGRGIEADFLPYVFDRFRQADASTTRSEGGLGIGLSIVRHLTELHGGTVEVKSKGSGQGSRFIVRMPIIPSDPALGFREAGTIDGGALASRLRNVQVLVVDDDEDARNVTAAVLERCGAVVIRTDSVRNALILLDQVEVDVIVSDIGMPQSDGYRFIAELRKLPRTATTPVLALTAYAGVEEERAILRAGFDDYLPKPTIAGALVAAVARILERGEHVRSR